MARQDMDRDAQRGKQLQDVRSVKVGAICFVGR